MKENFRLQETEWSAGEFTISINSSISCIIFYYMSTTSISQKIDLLSGLEKAAFDDVSRVWTGMHSQGIITREVCIKQTGLYTSPMLVRTLVVGLHKEEICSDWVTHQWWALPRVRSGVTSLGPSHGRLCPCGPAQICPCCHLSLPYQTSAQHSGSSSTSVCILSAALHCWPSLRAGRTGAANLPPAELSSQQPTLYQKQAAGMLFLSHWFGVTWTMLPV